MPRRADDTFKSGYFPELDMFSVLGPVEAAYYQSLIGVVKWMIEIRHIDMNIELSLLLSHSAMPRWGHFVAALHIMCNLKLRHISRLVFDPSYIEM